jgi:hypothetical protein
LISIYANTHDHRTRPAFQDGDITLLCITSLHHRRYVEDVIHAIGLPIGAHIRLRYRKPYVDQRLWDDIQSGAVRNNYYTLIALASETDNNSSKIIPLRKGKIVAANCEGDLAIIDISLLEFIFEISPRKSFTEILSSKATNLPVSVKQSQSSPGSYLQCLSTAVTEISANASVKGWEKVASAYFELDKGLTGVPNSYYASFLYHVKAINRKRTARLRKTGRISISMGEAFDVEIHTIARTSDGAIKNPLGEIVLDLSHAAANFVSSRRIRIDSNRDVKKIGLITTPLFTNADGHLSIRTSVFKYKAQTLNIIDTAGVSATPPEDFIAATDRTEVLLARYDFPLRVGGARPIIASALIAGAAALSVYKVSSQGTFNIIDAGIPSIIFLLTFFGLALGIIKK